MSPDNDLNIIKPVPSSQNITVSSPVNQHKEKKQPRQNQEKKTSANLQQPEKTPEETNENKSGDHVIDYRA